MYSESTQLHPHFEQRFKRLQRACERNGASLIPLTPDGYLTLLRYRNREYVFSSEALPLNSASAQAIAKDKLATYQILGYFGFALPKGLAVFADQYRGRATGVDRCLLLDKLEPRLREMFPEANNDPVFPFIVKPGRESMGLGVVYCAGIHAAKEEAEKLLHTSQFGRYAIVQEFVRGSEYRIAFLDAQQLVAYAKDTLLLVGDGASSLRELYSKWFDELSEDMKRITRRSLEGKVMIEGLGQISSEHIPMRGRALEFASLPHNLAQGTKPVLISNLPQDVIDMAKNAGSALGLRYFGTDIRLRSETGDPVIIEVNGNPAFDQLERAYPQLTESIAEHVVASIVKEIITNID